MKIRPTKRKMKAPDCPYCAFPRKPRCPRCGIAHSNFGESVQMCGEIVRLRKMLSKVADLSRDRWTDFPVSTLGDIHKLAKVK